MDDRGEQIGAWYSFSPPMPVTALDDGGVVIAPPFGLGGRESAGREELKAESAAVAGRSRPSRKSRELWYFRPADTTNRPTRTGG